VPFKIGSRLAHRSVTMGLYNFIINYLDIVRSTNIDSGDTTPPPGLKLSTFSITFCLHRKGGGL